MDCHVDDTDATDKSSCEGLTKKWWIVVFLVQHNTYYLVVVQHDPTICYCFNLELFQPGTSGFNDVKVRTKGET